MQKSNNLTKKEFWSDGWKNIHLPARFFYADFSHIVLDKLISKYIDPSVKSFLEIGGCPGRWADYFFTRHAMICDSMDYDENNIKILEKNYKLLGIKGNVFLGDITNTEVHSGGKYDIVLSDGLLEHFIDSKKVFENHLKYLKKNGVLIIGVPNIKKSWIYNYFARFDKEGYAGYRHVDAIELERYAREYKLEILYCGYVGVFNIGVAHTKELSPLLGKFFTTIYILSSFLLNILKIKKETNLFSPYIYLIAKKYE
jgi:SAM-dependent methyltransferase